MKNKRYYLIAGLLVLYGQMAIAQGNKIKSTDDLIRVMMKKNKADSYKSYTFVQKTVMYGPNEGETKESTWYEAIVYPDQFRIDYGPKENGNAVIYRNDSVYAFRDKKLVYQGKEFQEFLLVEGGMYQYDNYKDVIARINEFGYDTSKFYETTYNSHDVYVFGADEGDLNSKQMWVDKKEFYLCRKFSKLRDGKVLETQYDAFKNIDGHWVETKVRFLVEGKVVQDEYYNDIKLFAEIDPAVFDPKRVWEVYWYE